MKTKPLPPRRVAFHAMVCIVAGLFLIAPRAIPAAGENGAAQPNRPEGINFWGLDWVWGLPGPKSGINLLPGDAYLRTTFRLPAEPSAVRSAVMQVTADDGCEVFLNGHSLGVVGEPGVPSGAWQIIHEFDAAAHLADGLNVLAIHAWNAGNDPTPAGVCGRLLLEHEAADDPWMLPIDTAWQSAVEVHEGWNDSPDPEGEWKPATRMRFVGADPWGEIGATRRIMPPDFPRFEVRPPIPEMATLRALLHEHLPTVPAQGTLWDYWTTHAQLWPANKINGRTDGMRNQVRALLMQRRISPAGYVSTHQHNGLGHDEGWPFPIWTQSHGMGWHFTLRGAFFGNAFNVFAGPPVDWKLVNAETVGHGHDWGWSVRLAHEPLAILEAPPLAVDVQVAPFIRLDWRLRHALPGARFWLEWTTDAAPGFSPERRMYFEVPEPGDFFDSTMIPTWRHDQWRGTLTGLRLGLENAQGAEIDLRSVVTAPDTRHNINNAVFVLACSHYLQWTRDLEFAREMLPRVRKAARWAIREFGVERHGNVFTPWVGHDGRSGISYDAEGNKVIRHGLGVGNNYFDLLPFGGHDFTATYLLADALAALAGVERAVEARPGWNLPRAGDAMGPEALERLARTMRLHSREKFWNDQTDRFYSAIDIEGKGWDYGFVFSNLEAIHHGMASDAQARLIMDWISGRRIVPGDTSQGDDIYAYRFAPRITTRRNIDYYGYMWPNPEQIPFGDQIQDGGAVLGFSYFDLMGRLRVYGPDNAWARLREILAWFEETQAEGGYRAYYAKPGRGTMQGGGPPGGIGIDKEFFESILVPQVMLYGFMGFEPHVDGFKIAPDLPAGWDELAIPELSLHGMRVGLAIGPGWAEVSVLGGRPSHERVTLPAGRWSVQTRSLAGDPLREATWTLDPANPHGELWLEAGHVVRFEKID